MRQGLYEVFMVYEDHQCFPETTIDGKTYFHAEPNRHYYVKINVHRDPVTHEFPAKYLRLGLYVDGNDVQYWKRLDLTNLENNEQYASSSSSYSSSSSSSSTSTKTTESIRMASSHFYGFKKNCEEIISFKAVLPSTVSSSARSILNAKDLESSLGTIRVVIFEARVTGGIYNNQSGFHEIPRDHEVLAEKKFWKQASVATAGGRKVDSEKEKFLPLVRWENVSKIPMATIEAFYHTPQTILILKNIFADQQKSSSRPQKRSLCADDDDDKEKNKAPRRGDSNGDDSDNDSVATVEDVTLVIKEQVVPFLDLSRDDDEKLEWQSVVIKK